jgi:hypothetical protein
VKKVNASWLVKEIDISRETQMVVAETNTETLPNDKAADTQRSQGFKHSQH